MCSKYVASYIIEFTEVEVNVKFRSFCLLFMVSFIFGGFYSAYAYKNSMSFNGLKADYLRKPHYMPDVIGRNGGTVQSGIVKTTYSVQQWSIVTNGDRKILFAVSDQDGSPVSGITWLSYSNTGGLIDVCDSNCMMSLPTSETTMKFAVAAKLALPWTQATVKTGLWVIDN